MNPKAPEQRKQAFTLLTNARDLLKQCRQSLENNQIGKPTAQQPSRSPDSSTDFDVEATQQELDQLIGQIESFLANPTSDSTSNPAERLTQTLTLVDRVLSIISLLDKIL